MGRKKIKPTIPQPAFKRPQLNLKHETRKTIISIFFIVIAILFTLSLTGSAGSFGQVASKVLRLAFGWMSYGVPLIFLLVASALLRHDDADDSNTVSTHAYVGAVLLTVALTGFLHVLVLKSGTEQAFQLVKEGQGGGYLGVLTSYPLMQLMGFVASMVVIVAAVLISFLITFNISLRDLLFKKSKPESQPQGTKLKTAPLKINNGAAGFTKDSVGEANKAIKEPEREKLEQVVHNHADAPIEQHKVTKAMLKENIDKSWKFPSLDFLEETKTKVDSGNIEANVAIIQKTLADFGIEVEMGEVNVGPTVTQYTLRPAIGVKLSQIAALQNDLALALAASSIRMELPIPGKALVGVEIPNRSTALVRIKEIIGSSLFANSQSRLTFSLGRDVAGHPMTSDLAKMPHLLIAGATGSGKSVCVNSLLVSLLYRATPSEVKLIVIDPKRVELSLYNGIPHLMTPVVTDHQQAVNALKWAVLEMDRRYKLLAEVHKRNISEFNASSLMQLPYLVIVVDELADLMAVAQNEVEGAIVRLAQMARAVGIHLVVATQRPSVDVITGLIKANITARIAFAVASQVDSRTILDMAGAEKLLGCGDMLYITSDLPKPKRIQGTFVTEKEIRKITDFIREQAGAVIYDEKILEKQRHESGIPGFEGDGGDDDELVAQAVEVVQSAGKASASLLQRRLRIGYARAARMLDILEDKGIVGPGEGAKPREVYGVTAGEDEGQEETENF